MAKKEKEVNFLALLRQTRKRFKPPVDRALFIFFLSLPLAIVSSFLEALGLGLLVPLVEVVLNNGTFESFAILQQVYTSLNLTTTSEIVVATALLIVLSTIIKNILQYIHTVINARVTSGLVNEMRKSIMTSFIKRDYLFFEKNKPGELSYIISLSGTFPIVFSQSIAIINTALMSFFYLLFLFYLSTHITFFLFFILPILFFALKKVKKSIERLNKEGIKIGERFSNRSFDILSSPSLIKSYGTEKEEIQTYAGISDELTENNISVAKRTALIPLVEEPIIVLAVVSIAIISYVLFISGVKGALAGFMTYFVILRRFESKAQNLFGLLVRMTAQKPKLQAFLDAFSVKPWMIIRSGKKPFTSLKKAITFKNVTFSYEKGGKPILNNISLHIKKGSSVALVGHSGSGKTTLVSLLPRIFDYTQGTIKIDGTSLKQFDVRSLRHHIGIVSQDIVILNRTLKENILYGLDRTVSQEEIDTACEQADLKEFIKKLPQGYETTVGEKGSELSGGQRQRIAIARAILRNPSILILDEATSALDTQTEKRIQQALYTVAKGKTTFMIAHRLSTIEKADQVVVLEKGTIVEKGTFKQLLKKKGRFYHYWKLQSSLNH